MRHLRTTFAVALTAALSLAALAGPVEAGTTKAALAFVNGIPGKKVDVCINGYEVRSALKYGGVAYKRIKPGTKALRFRVAGPGTCRGAALAGKTLKLGAGDDLTIVGTRSKPKKVTVLDNAGKGALGPVGTTWMVQVVRHAADIHPVWFDYDQDYVGWMGLTPSALPNWEKGRSWMRKVDTDQQVLVTLRVRKVPTNAIVAGPIARFLEPGHRYEWVLVGTRPGNARIVTIKRSIADPQL